MPDVADPKAKEELEGWPVDQPFFLLSDAYPDGSLYINGEVRSPGAHEEQERNALRIVNTYGGVQYLVRCEVVRTLTLADSEYMENLRHAEWRDANLENLLWSIIAIVKVEGGPTFD